MAHDAIIPTTRKLDETIATAMLYLVVFEFEPKSFLFETQQHTHKKKIGKKKIYAL